LDRNRYKRGSDNGSAKLTPEQVTEIRRGWKDGLQQVDMARHYAVSKSTIQWILNGRTWSGIGELP
jgi:DNA-binding transcriptional regulator YiaG